jgi:hypothetical protein
VPTNRLFHHPLFRRLVCRRVLVLMLLALGLAVLAVGLASSAPGEAAPVSIPTVTFPHPDFPIPLVTSTGPDDGKTNVAYDPDIWVEFSRAMDPSTLSSASFYLTKADGTWVTATRRCRVDNLAWWLYPVDPLEPGVTYVVTLTTEAKAENGAALAAKFTWSFTTVLFADVDLDNPYAVAISHLAGSVIISGYADQTFRPGEPVKRMQFAKMIALMMTGGQVTTSGVCPFSDVPSGLDVTDPLYPDKYVAAAYDMGIIKGKTATTFAPYESITRYQLITMLIRAIQQKMPVYLQTPPPEYQSTWDPLWSSDHGENARLAEFNHLLSNIPIANLSPWDAMPRGEVAQVLDNIGG